MALNKGIWDPKLRGTNIKGTNLKSLIHKPPTPKVPKMALRHAAFFCLAEQGHRNGPLPGLCDRDYAKMKKGPNE